MSELSPEDRKRILAEVRRNIECADAAANVAHEARLVAMVAQLVDQRIAELRGDLAAVAEAVGKLAESVNGAIDHLRDAAREPTQAVNQHVDALFERLDRRLDELAPHRARDDDEVIDLPNPLVRHIN
jgi:methyl-accepting chemotaxis protein